MTPAKSNFSQTVASSWFSLVITSACQLVTIPIALSELNKGDFALYAVIGQMLMAVMLAEFGVRSACSRLLIDAISKGQNAYRRMWMASAVVFCLQAVVMLIFMLMLVPFIGGLFHLEGSELATARGIFLTIGAIQVVNYALSINSTSLFAAQKLNQSNVLATISTVLHLIVFTISIKSGAGLWAYPISIFAQVACTQSLAFALALKSGLICRPRISLLDRENVKVVFRLGFDVFVAALFSMVMGNSLLIFSGHLLTLDATAVLAVNLKLITLMTHILQRIPGSAAPMLMKMVSEEKGYQFRLWWSFVTKSTLALSLFSAGIFVIWNHFVVTAWAGAGMALSLPSAVLLSLNAYRYLVHYQFVNTLTVFKEIRRVKMYLVWEVILFTILAYVLGRRFGMNGLLAANLLSMLGGALPAGIRWMACFAEVPVRAQLQLLLRISAPLAAVFAFLAWQGHPFFATSLLGCLVISIAWFLLFIALGYLLILDSRERQELTGLMSHAGHGFLRFVSPKHKST
jgi:O-antigen/teichoic acid export membrane protein